jgi:alkylhydroperoxidase/carboxymuconolactone decarboxylase family protein YurZ
MNKLRNPNSPVPSPDIVDERVAQLIAVGAAMAANSEPCFAQAVASLKEEGVQEALIRGAVEIGQTVKDKPATVMKGAADTLTGTSLSAKPKDGAFPMQNMERGSTFNLTMLIAAGAAMAAGCEPCLNSAIPQLIEAGVAEADIRKAVEIGQAARDSSGIIMKEAAAALAGATFAEKVGANEQAVCESEPIASCCG